MARPNIEEDAKKKAAQEKHFHGIEIIGAVKDQNQERVQGLVLEPKFISKKHLLEAFKLGLKGNKSVIPDLLLICCTSSNGEFLSELLNLVLNKDFFNLEFAGKILGVLNPPDKEPQDSDKYIRPVFVKALAENRGFSEENLKKILALNEGLPLNQRAEMKHIVEGLKMQKREGKDLPYKDANQFLNIFAEKLKRDLSDNKSILGLLDGIAEIFKISGLCFIVEDLVHNQALSPQQKIGDFTLQSYFEEMRKTFSPHFLPTENEVTTETRKYIKPAEPDEISPQGIAEIVGEFLKWQESVDEKEVENNRAAITGLIKFLEELKQGLKKEDQKQTKNIVKNPQAEAAVAKGTQQIHKFA